MAAQSDSEAAESKSFVSLIYNPKVRGLFFQILVVVILVAGVWWFVDNTIVNLAHQGKKSGFRFLDDTGGFQILATLGTYFLNYAPGVSTYLDVFWIGVINTLIVAFLGIVATTVLGFLLGIFRLSSNAVLRSFATVYIEVLRNIPLLLQIFFWYFVVLRALPGSRGRVSIFDGLFGLNLTGLYGPFPVPEPGLDATLIGLLVGVLGAIGVWRWATKRQAATGRQFPRFWVGFGLVVLVPLAVFVLTGSPLSWEQPVFSDTGPIFRRGYQNGVGMVIKPEMISIWLALTLYTATFIAEIVRAGILAVPHGQTEAARALGLRPGATLRLVVIPQAMRVIIPPLTSQYLNLTKNSSLAVAIAYPDIVSVFAGTVLNQVGQEIEIILMMMMVYLTISIVTSIFMNWFNARMRLVER